MKSTLTLASYVKRRNGVALGAKGSLSNMLYRSLGANSFASFWRYWNPIWGYYLGRLVYGPLQKWLPPWFAVMITFTVSGAIHDIAIMLVKQQQVFLFTPWFLAMSFCVVLSNILNINYKNFTWMLRALINLTYIGACLFLVKWLT